MQNVLIIDTETTGLHPDKGDKVIEVGAVLYSIKHKVMLQSFSTLLPCQSNPVEHINNIKAEWTREPMALSEGIVFLKYMAKQADAFVAHNADFDKKFLLSLKSLESENWSNRWICTRNNFKWPVSLCRYRLQDICNAMGVPYVDAHRALTDCNFIASCFSKVHDLGQRLQDALDKKSNSFGMEIVRQGDYR